MILNNHTSKTITVQESVESQDAIFTFDEIKEILIAQIIKSQRLPFPEHKLITNSCEIKLETDSETVTIVLTHYP